MMVILSLRSLIEDTLQWGVDPVKHAAIWKPKAKHIGAGWYNGGRKALFRHCVVLALCGSCLLPDTLRRLFRSRASLSSLTRNSGTRSSIAQREDRHVWHGEATPLSNEICRIASGTRVKYCSDFRNIHRHRGSFIHELQAKGEAGVS